MHEYLVTIIHGKERIQRRVIASNSISATLTGLAMFGKAEVIPLSIFCKPLERIARWQPSTAA